MCENRCRREGRGGLPKDTVLREGRQAMGTRVRKEDTHFIEDLSKVIAWCWLPEHPPAPSVHAPDAYPVSPLSYQQKRG